VEDVTVVQGLRCTTLARTVVDLVGTLPVEAAISVADAALRIVAWDPATRRYDDTAAERWRNELLERLATRAGHRGIGQARWVVQFADGRAQRPGESISRLYLHWLGFAPPRLQVPVPGPGGRTWWLDFGLDDIPVWGEFDGERKYLDPTMLAGKTAGRAVLDEKWREDYIRGSTRRAVLRWGDAHISTPAALARRLTEFAVELPRPRARIHMSVRRSSF
jgi:GNAT superfamily N-acetyltransferase